MNLITNTLYEMLDRNDIKLSKQYQNCIESYLTPDLSFTSELMKGLAKTIFQSKQMMAYYLLHNSIDEAKGAARLKLMAEKYADLDLRKKMMRHYHDEMNHSAMFASLIPYTGYFLEQNDADVSDEINVIMDFDDDLTDFIFRVHSIEIRSWQLLLLHLDIINDSEDEYMKKMKTTIERILSDEIRHVSYTAQYVSDVLYKSPEKSESFINCINHTNKETWEDLSNMSLFMKNNVGKYHSEVVYDN